MVAALINAAITTESVIKVCVVYVYFCSLLNYIINAALFF